VRLHQKFKWERIAQTPRHEEWTITLDEVLGWKAHAEPESPLPAAGSEASRTGA
jgi:hypothetical protein